MVGVVIMISLEGCKQRDKYERKMNKRIKNLEAAQKEIQIIIDKLKAEQEERSHLIY